MIQTQIKKNNDLSKLFVFDDYEGEVQQAFLDEVGTLIFQSALMQYMATHTEEEVENFEAFINSHVEAESFMDTLCSEYEDFEKLLMQEMKAFRSEIIFD